MAGSQRVTVTFPGNTTVVPTYDNTVGIYCALWFAAGPTYNTGNVANLSQVWSATNGTNRASGCSNLWSVANSQFNLVEAQLEAGSVATPTELLVLSDDMARCQRYSFYPGADAALGSYAYLGQGWATNTTTGFVAISFPVTMRERPVIDLNALPQFTQYAMFDRLGTQVACTNLQIDNAAATRNTAGVIATVASGLTAFRPYQLLKIAGQTGNVGFSADI